MRVAVAGLVHGHVEGFLRPAKDRPDVEIVGIADPDAALHRKYQERVGLPERLFFQELETMLERTKPDAVAAFTSTYEHEAVVAACARRRIPVMMEKPLAVSVDEGHYLRDWRSSSAPKKLAAAFKMSLEVTCLDCIRF